MSKIYESPVCIAVLNPKGRDPFLDYSDGPAAFREGEHAPVNFHAYAAATFGAFFDSTDEVLKSAARFDAVVVLIRRRTWITLEAVRRLKNAGLTVFVAWKECGHTQITNQLYKVKALLAYEEIIQLADRIITPTLAHPPRCGPIGHREFWDKVIFVPTPYPVDYPEWDFSTEVNDRSGIMIGTREFKTLARNHIHALSRGSSLAHELNLNHVTVINSDKKMGMTKLREVEKSFPKGCLRIIDNPLSYPDYMDLLSSHRLVFQMDRSGVPGQVAGDCLLARTLCAGGNSSIEQIAFSNICDDGSLHINRVFDEIRNVLSDDEAYCSAVEDAQQIATSVLSFEAVASEFGNMLRS